MLPEEQEPTSIKSMGLPRSRGTERSPDTELEETILLSLV